MSTLSPENTDIAHRYSAKSLDQKVRNKTDLQQQLGWAAEPRRAMICLPAGMSDALGGKLFTDVLPGLLTQQIEVIVLGKGGSAYGKMFTDLAKEYGHRIGILKNDAENVHAMLAASDMALFLSTDPAVETQRCLRFGVVPIAPTGTPHLENYDPVQERGNAFLYEETKMWQCFAALIRALETYRFPYDWRTIQRHCMESNH